MDMGSILYLLDFFLKLEIFFLGLIPILYKSETRSVILTMWPSGPGIHQIRFGSKLHFSDEIFETFKNDTRLTNVEF